VPIKRLSYALFNSAENPAEPHWFDIGDLSRHHVMNSLQYEIKDYLTRAATMEENSSVNCIQGAYAISMNSLW